MFAVKRSAGAPNLVTDQASQEAANLVTDQAVAKLVKLATWSVSACISFDDP